MDTPRHTPPGTRPQIARTRRYTWILPLLAVVIVATVVIRWLPETPSERSLAKESGAAVLRAPAAQAGAADAVSMEAGRNAPARRAETDHTVATSGVEVAPTIVKELETITGVVDGHELIGRHVDLRVPVHTAGSGDVTFWIGSGDNRLLVVLARDRRDEQARAQGQASRHGIEPLNGQVAAISGTVQRVPEAEDRVSWRLTGKEEQELRERNIYIRADRVTADGHGG